MNEFDLKAAGWDQNPMIWDRAEAIAKEIIKLIPLNNKMSALEFGAGTGVTSFILKDFLKEITLMDTSSEMLKMTDNKIKSARATNLKTINFDLEHADYKKKKFDLIFTQMVLHHITDIETILGKFHNLLNPGGYLAIADLYSEDGSFHGDGFTGHNGFDPLHLSDILFKLGFKNISHRQCYVINKEINDSVKKQFRIFLLAGNLA